jgi:hypothetical protein
VFMELPTRLEDNGFESIAILDLRALDCVTQPMPKLNGSGRQNLPLESNYPLFAPPCLALLCNTEILLGRQTFLRFRVFGPKAKTPGFRPAFVQAVSRLGLSPGAARRAFHEARRTAQHRI